jgi:N6-L-threonylcarbamoyladenine synthase
MYILGIETSCDETAASVVKDGKIIYSHVVISSLKEHGKYGGIIPEIASRRQLECITPIVEEALQKANCSLNKIDAIAVTTSPGLIGSLLVGVSFARALSFTTRKPLIGVDHIKAHLYANFLAFKDQASKFVQPKLPAIGLIVSGGHTSLYLVKSFDQFKLLGQTIDDAAGEAYDKVARILNLGYPGGPAIDRLAKTWHSQTRIGFPRSNVKNFDFSFSGLKTAVLYYKRDHDQAKDFSVPQVAYSFQENVVHALVEKSIQACHTHKIKTLLLGGGVAANSRLRTLLQEEGDKQKISVFVPPLGLCLDNASMIAGLGFHLWKKNRRGQPAAI